MTPIKTIGINLLVLGLLPLWTDMACPGHPAPAAGSPDAPSRLTKEGILQRLQERFEPAIDVLMKRLCLPGLSVAVVHHNQRIYARAWGMKNISTGDPTTTRSLFHQASVTKPFVATAIMQLVEQKRIALDSPVVTYLPYFKLADPLYASITIRHMLSHTSGMPDVEDYEWDKPVFDDTALERYVRGLSQERMLFKPGEKFRYSNMAYEVLGDVVAKVSGSSFEDYVRGHILKPLNMNDSTLMKQEADPALITTPHVIKDEAIVVSDIFPYNRMHAPSSTLISSIQDMSRWAMANLNRGILDGVRILQGSTYDRMWQREGRVAGSPVGLSWFLGSHGSFHTVQHSGGDTGYRSFVMLIPELTLGIVMASNFDRAPIVEIMETAVHICLGENYQPRFTREQLVLTSDDCGHYAGDYRVRENLTIQVQASGRRLYVEAPGYDRVEIFAQSPDHFYAVEFPLDFTFVRDAQAKVVKVILHHQGRDIPALKLAP